MTAESPGGPTALGNDQSCFEPLSALPPEDRGSFHDRHCSASDSIPEPPSGKLEILCR